MMPAALIALVPAAGLGTRAGQVDGSAAPKQYRLLAGMPMLRHAVLALLAEPRIAQVRVAVAPDDRWAAAALAGLPRTVWHPCGGSTRAQTVANALADSAVSAQSWVLVHDAARPGLPLSALQRLIDACLDDSVGGLLAMPVPDTVKLAMSISDTLKIDGQRVMCTEARQQRWLAQTPQMFPADKLRRALHEAARQGLAITDEAQALEAMGHAPLLVRGHSRNFKVTWPEDFELMEKWL